MERKTVIVLEKCPNIMECYGSLEMACIVHPEFDIEEIQEEGSPFYYQGWTFNKLEVIE
jgi:hypothetical protein